jgi:hypothetical protein
MKVKPLVKRFSGQYWKAEISRSTERFKKFVEMAEESIRVYNAQKNLSVFEDAERRLNCWWYCVNSLLPAYFSSTPKAEVNLRKRTGGIIEELTAVGIERNLQYSMDTDFSFDSVGRNAGLQYLLTGFSCLWARYESEIEDETVEIAVFEGPDGQLVDADGMPFQQEILEVKEGVGSIKIAKVSAPMKKEEEACLEVVQYNDYFCSDCRSQDEIEWQARRAFMSREEAESTFGEELADKLTYDHFPEKDRKDYKRGEEQYEGKAEIYEIWCEESDKVYWASKGYKDFVFKESEPPIKFEGFYPCVVIAQNLDPDSVIPVSDYVHVRDQILEVERLTTRIHALTKAIRTNFAYDSSLGASMEQLFEGDLKGLPMNNWPSYKARGGLANSMEFLDIQTFVNALQILQGTREAALQQLYETLKVSDLLRGTSEQYKSATANRLEAQWSSLGLIVRQNMFTKFISDALGKLGDIISSQFSPERFFEIADMDRQIQQILPPPPPPPAPDPNLPPEQQPPPPPYNPQLQVDLIKQQIINLIRNEDKRCYRIAIASDSMVAIDQAQEQQEGMALMSTCGEFFNQMKALIEQYPPLLGFSVELFQNVIKRFKGGKELDGIFTKALGQVGEIAKAKEEAAKQPPPPDPIVQEMEGRLQIAQMEAQVRMQSAQMDMQDKAVKNQLAQQEQQLKMQRDGLESQLLIQKQQFDEYMKQQELLLGQQEIQIKANSVQVDMLKVQSNAENEKSKQAIMQETSRMGQILELQKMELERMRVKLSEAEKLMEERRLASANELERIKVSMDAIQRMPQSPIMVSTDKPMIIEKAPAPTARKKRKGKIISDETGNPIGIEIQDEE